MPAIVRWDPFKELGTIQERMNRIFDEVWGRRPRGEEDYLSSAWIPAVDVRESRDALEIQVEVPGIDPKDVQVAVENGILVIKGSRNFEKATEAETYHRVERAYGSFERSFTLPTNVDPEKIKATYKHGVLNLSLAKREEAKPRSIAINIEE